MPKSFEYELPTGLVTITQEPDGGESSIWSAELANYGEIGVGESPCEATSDAVAAVQSALEILSQYVPLSILLQHEPLQLAFDAFVEDVSRADCAAHDHLPPPASPPPPSSKAN